jgi:hypothetical protein
MVWCAERERSHVLLGDPCARRGFGREGVAGREVPADRHSSHPLPSSSGRLRRQREPRPRPALLHGVSASIRSQPIRYGSLRESCSESRRNSAAGRARVTTYPVASPGPGEGKRSDGAGTQRPTRSAGEDARPGQRPCSSTFPSAMNHQGVLHHRSPRKYGRCQPPRSPG